MRRRGPIDERLGAEARALEDGAVRHGHRRRDIRHVDGLESRLAKALVHARDQGNRRPRGLDLRWPCRSHDDEHVIRH